MSWLWVEGVVPFAVEVVAGQDAFGFKVFHLLVGDFDAGGVGRSVELGVDGQPVLVVVAAMVSTITSWLVNGLPRQFIEMWENNRCSTWGEMHPPEADFGRTSLRRRPLSRERSLPRRWSLPPTGTATMGDGATATGTAPGVPGFLGAGAGTGNGHTERGAGVEFVVTPAPTHIRGSRDQLAVMIRIAYLADTLTWAQALLP